MFLKKQIFKINVLKKLLTEENSCVTLVPTNRLLALPPCYLNDIKKGIFFILNNSLKKYDQNLDGILIGYQNVKILMDEKTGLIPMGVAETRVNISVEFYIFQPKIGGLLQGVINKKTNQHIGCLVHKYFNATILRPEDVDYDIWEGKHFNVDDHIKFRVKDLDFTGMLPRIEGIIIDLDSPGGNNSKEINNKMFDGDDSKDGNCENKLLESEEFWKMKLNNGNWSLSENDLENDSQLKNTVGAKLVENIEELEDEMRIQNDTCMEEYFSLRESKKRKKDCDDDNDDIGSMNKLKNVSNQKPMENTSEDSGNKILTQVETDKVDKDISPHKKKKRKRDHYSNTAEIDSAKKFSELKNDFNGEQVDSDKKPKDGVQTKDTDIDKDISPHKKKKRKRDRDSDKSAIDIAEKTNELKKDFNAKQAVSNEEVESEAQTQKKFDVNEDVSLHNKKKRKQISDHNNSATHVENLAENSLLASNLKSGENNKESEEETQTKMDTDNIDNDISPKKKKKKKRDRDSDKSVNDLPEKSIENDKEIEVEDKANKVAMEEAEDNIFSSTQIEPFSKLLNIEFCSPIHAIPSSDKKKTKSCEKTEQKQKPSADRMKNKLEKKILSKMKKKLLLSPKNKITCDNAMVPELDGFDLKKRSTSGEISSEENLEVNPETSEKHKSNKTETNETKQSNSSETNEKMYSKNNGLNEKKDSKNSETNEKQDKITAADLDKNELEKKILSEMKKKFLLSPEKKMAKVDLTMLEVDEVDLTKKSDKHALIELKDSVNGEVNAMKYSNSREMNEKIKSRHIEKNEKQHKSSSEHFKNKLQKKILSKIKKKFLMSSEKEIDLTICESDEVDLTKKSNDPAINEMNKKKELNGMEVKKNKKSNSSEIKEKKKSKKNSKKSETNEKHDEINAAAAAVEFDKNKLEEKILSEMKKKFLLSPEKKIANIRPEMHEEDEVDLKKKSSNLEENEMEDSSNRETNTNHKSNRDELKETKKFKNSEKEQKKKKESSNSEGEKNQKTKNKGEKHEKRDEINAAVDFDKNELEEKILSEMKKKFLLSPEKKMADVHSAVIEKDEVDLAAKPDKPEGNEKKHLMRSEIKEKEKSKTSEVKRKKESIKNSENETNEKQQKISSEPDKHKLEKKILSEMKKKLLLSPEKKMADVNSAAVLESNEVESNRMESSPSKIGSHFVDGDSSKRLKNSKESKSMERLEKKKVKKKKKNKTEEVGENNVSALYSKLLQDAVNSLNLPEVDCTGKTSGSDFESPAEKPVKKSKEKISRKRKNMDSYTDPKRKSMNSSEVETETNFESDLKTLNESVEELINLREKIIENQTKKSHSNSKSSDECEKDSNRSERSKKGGKKEIEKHMETIPGSLLDNFLKLSGVKEKTKSNKSKKEKKVEEFESLFSG